MIQPNSRHNARSQLTVPASANPSEMRKTRRLEEINYTLVNQRQIFQEILTKNLVICFKSEILQISGN